MVEQSFTTKDAKTGTRNADQIRPALEANPRVCDDGDGEEDGGGGEEDAGEEGQGDGGEGGHDVASRGETHQVVQVELHTREGSLLVMLRR